MLKPLHKNDTQITPFVATKDWELSNLINEDLILMEHSGVAGNPVALEYVEYDLTTPVLNISCSIALENQPNDKVLFRDGQKGTGIFYPDTEPANTDGTFKRLVYTQIKDIFYNNYRDPTKIWGIEQIDFDKSQTKRFISDQFKMFIIPTVVYGEKIIENTVILYDNTTDNNVIVTDDGNTNLFAGTNLFSHQQELGDFSNIFITGSNIGCDVYAAINIPSPMLSGSFVSLSGNFATGTLSWSLAYTSLTPLQGFSLERSLDGITYSVLQTLNPTASFTLDVPLSRSVIYYYRIDGWNVFGTGSYSNVVTITPLLPNWPGNFTTTSFDYVSGVIGFGVPFEFHSGQITNTSASFNVTASNSAINAGGVTLYTASATTIYSGPVTSASLHINSLFFHGGFGGGPEGKVEISQSGVGMFGWIIPSGPDTRTVSFVLSASISGSLEVRVSALCDVSNSTAIEMSGSFTIP